MSFMNLENLFNFCTNCLEGGYGPLLQTFGIVLFVLVFNFVIKTLLIRLGKIFGKHHNKWALSFVSALHKPLSLFVWAVACLSALDIMTSGLFSFHLENIHLLISVGAVLTFGWFLLRWNREILFLMKEKTRESHLTPIPLDLLSKLATIAIIFITVFLLLDVTGRSVQTLIAFGGIGGLALAIASQQVISNFFGGLMIYLTRPFTIGEWVNLPEKHIEGHIEEIGWYLTLIRNFEKRPIYVPNSIFTQTVVITPSRMSHERFNHTIGLRYRDINAVKPIVDNIKGLLMNHPDIDHCLNVDVYFTKFGLSSLDIFISAYTGMTTSKKFSALRQELLLGIAEIVAKEGAEIAKPANTIEIVKNTPV